MIALVCQPDRPKGRSKTPQAPPTKQWAAKHDLPVHQPTKLNDGAFAAWLRDQRPDLCALVAYGRILKQPILDVPPHGFLNMHPSALPQYRGPAPIQAAILNGETETAITIMRLDAGMDSGDILLQQPFMIDPHDTTETLSERLGVLGAELMVEAVRRIESGTATFTPQDHEAATYTKMLDKADGAIDWTQPAPAIHNLVRAANPWPMAHAKLDGETYRILQTRVEDRSLADPPGTVVRADACNLLIATGNGAIAIEVIQAPGKKPMHIADFLRGRSIPKGARFE